MRFVADWPHVARNQQHSNQQQSAGNKRSGCRLNAPLHGELAMRRQQPATQQPATKRSAVG